MKFKKKILSVLKRIRNIYRYAKKLYCLKRESILDIKSKPTVLNLNIIDSCNSKCTMCNIWKQDEELEISPEQLKIALKNPLFSDIKHVGVTGGEPTLRNDLPQIYETIIQAIPNISGLSIISNAIESDDVIQKITEIKLICDRYNVPFSAMISIDGVGKAHDQVRGIKGNFENSIKVFNYLEKELKIHTSFGCTISKVNAWDADDLLFYAKSNGIYGRFRIAESINRLYNQNRSKVIRNFDDDETYNLLLFFEKLKTNYEWNESYRRTYTSIQNILRGGERTIGCPYHKSGVVLGSKGQLSYCAPKSKEIGNVLHASAEEIYEMNFGEKERILKENCKNCIHDYHAPITYNEEIQNLKSKFFSKILNINEANKAIILARLLNRVEKKKNKYSIFIVGWYGTETVGDKAILGGILEYYKNKYKEENVEFIIGSLYPFITERTCSELKINAKVVSTKTLDLLRYAKSVNEVVMGGGPLMDLNELYVPYLGFKVAKLYGNKTTVFGCGIGPLKYDKFSKTVKKIFELTDEVKLRDRKSISIYNSYQFKNEAQLFGDPAIGYIQNCNKDINVEKEKILSCYLREWTFEYFIGDQEAFEREKVKFENGIASLIKEQADKLNVEKIEFHHMHNFVIGNDDRDFSRYFAQKYFYNDKRVYINKKLSTVDSIISSMKKSELNICMRFHSVVFAHTLNVDFIAIDYTMGGKIHSFLKDNNVLEKERTVEELFAEV